MKNKIYMCKNCGNIVTKIKDDGVEITCCNENMKELVPNTVDAAHEKHIPVVTIDNNIVTVNIGEVEHPMLEEHYITWIMLETKNGFQIKYLNPNEKPEVKFSIIDDEIKNVYSYCNTHGLWVKNFEK